MGDNGTQSAVLNPRQKRFVAALVAAPTVRDAAAAAEIGETTAWRYLQQPAVRAELNERQSAAMTHAVTGLADDMAAARVVLRELMDTESTPPTVRVSAARAILDAGIRLFEMVALAERVTRLEERLADRE
jgi:phage terminase small subunit